MFAVLIINNFDKIFGKKICIVPYLRRFIPHWKTCFILSVGIIQTSYSDGFYMLYVPKLIRSWVIVQTEKGC